MAQEAYGSLSDEALIEAVRGGDTGAVGFLMEKYKPLVRKLCYRRYLEGGDMDDLIQEGMIGLYEAIRGYDGANDRGASFFTFASLCINRQLTNAIEAARRMKMRILNESVSLSDESLAGILSEGEETSPETLVLEEEGRREILSRVAQTLSTTEQVVLRYYLKGYTTKEIARLTDRSPKSVDNAVQRIRRKLRQLKGKE